MEGQRGVHTQVPDTHDSPLGQRVPVPHEGPPGHTLGMSVPQMIVDAEVVGQRGVHAHDPPTQL